MLGRQSRGRLVVFGGLGLVLVAAVVSTVAVVAGGGGSGRPPVPPTRARAYTEQDACLLTGSSGVAKGGEAARVWDGMREASRDTRARVAYTPVTGAQTAANATPFLNGLFQRSCDVVVASGRAEVAAVREAAGGRPKTRFVLVGGTVNEEGAGGNTTVVAAGAGLSGRVASAVREALQEQ
ncbi:BMP family ABC transporter substrate-binding protein [Streptomyces sp. NPDC047046]|uniref:BMP family ABC transporter substrate-binding protein n=1 Tax=Streptomyces sp. NPDC047046 TaxID=3155378 RepID=UPI0033D7D8FC